MELSKRRKTVTAPPQTRSQSWQLSSPGISSLDDNLIFEILTRLSNPRSVLRCKSVCKRWNSLISTPDFLPDFLRRIATHGSEDEFPLLFPQSQQETMGFLPIPDKYRPRFRVLASCHDLILCGLTTRDYVENWFYVCNPFTKQWVILPLAPNRGEALRSQRIMVGFVCQPCYSYCGFKDQVLIDSQFKFRVVILYENGGAVFCSESGKWVDRFNHFQEGYGHFVTSDSHITLPSFNGKVYWKDDDSRQLVGFDPFDIGGVVETIDFSELYSHSPQLVCRFDIGVSKGSLHMIVAEQLEGDDSSVDGLSVWRLEGKKNWKLENRMSLRSILGRFNLQKNNRGGLMNSLEVKGVLGMHPSKPEIVYLAYANFGACYAVSCNFKNEELELCGTSTLESRFCWNVFQPEVPFWATPVPVPTYDRVVFSYVDGRTDSIVAHSNVVEPSELNSSPGRRMSFSWMRMIFWKMIPRV